MTLGFCFSWCNEKCREWLRFIERRKCCTNCMLVTPNTLLQLRDSICLCQPCFKKSLITVLFLVHRSSWCTFCISTTKLLFVVSRHLYSCKCSCRIAFLWQLFCKSRDMLHLAFSTETPISFWFVYVIEACLCNLLISASSSYFWL